MLRVRHRAHRQSELGRGGRRSVPGQDHRARHQRRRRPVHRHPVRDADRDHDIDIARTPGRHRDCHQHGGRTIAHAAVLDGFDTARLRHIAMPSVHDAVRVTIDCREPAHRCRESDGHQLGQRVECRPARVEPIFVPDRRAGHDTGTELFGMLQIVRRTSQARDGITLRFPHAALRDRRRIGNVHLLGIPVGNGSTTVGVLECHTVTNIVDHAIGNIFGTCHCML
mmetsp:Transcript_28042/g.78656  ORF Transcript_28042/g.78656 Transcript_28042/m.78656 type:complete len:225 (-) Transcript_28042:178-852(-)